jgi:hypothetical protein
MDWNLYLAFVVASSPSVLLTIAHSLAFGWRRALNTVLGATCGVAVQLSVALVGMTWFLLLMADWFEWLRWAGVAYLVYLGVQQWRAEPEAVPAEAGQTRGRALFLQSLAVTTANPNDGAFRAAAAAGRHLPGDHLRLHRLLGGPGGPGRAPVSHARADPPAQPAYRRLTGGRRPGPVPGAAGLASE